MLCRAVLFVVVCGFVWLHVAVGGCVRLCVAVCGSVWRFVAVRGCVAMCGCL